MAYETDLLEFDDVFEGSKVLKNKVNKLKKSFYNQIKEIDKLGGLVEAIENGFMKSKLVESQTIRQKSIETGEQQVVGVNCYTEGEESPLTNVNDGGFMKVDEKAEKKQIEDLKKFKSKRNEKKINSLLNQLKNTAKEGRNIMEISIKCAHAGITTGEWSNVMREVYGEYRAPTGIVSSHISKQNILKSEIKLLQKEVNMLEKNKKKTKNVSWKTRFRWSF